MSVTASQLAKAINIENDFGGIIKEQLNIIDNVLLKHDKKWGNNVVEYELPSNSVVIPGVTKSTCQRIIYGKIIADLESRGFNVKILVEKDRYTLFISWISAISGEDLDTLTSIIKSHTITREEISGLGRSMSNGRKNTGPPFGQQQVRGESSSSHEGGDVVYHN